MQIATKLVAFSEFSREEAIKNTGVKPDKLVTVYLGLGPLGERTFHKERLVITVGNVDRCNLDRKGLRAFVRAAALLPDVPFVLIGRWLDDAIESLRPLIGPNVQLVGWVDEESLIHYYSRASVYVQASRHEGFGLAVAEAMLHRCVPVVTRAGALPEVVGDAGIYIDSQEPATIAEGTERALALGPSWGQHARERVQREFPMQQRREGLYGVIELALSSYG